MLIWTNFLVLIRGNRAQNLSGLFSFTLYDYPIPTVSFRRAMLAEAVTLRNLVREMLCFDLDQYTDCPN
jgi:hypothetical protein